MKKLTATGKNLQIYKEGKLLLIKKEEQKKIWRRIIKNAQSGPQPKLGDI